MLGTSGGLVHAEFDPDHGGIHLPDHLKHWMQTFPRELRVGTVQFAHVSPLPAHTHYDDLFYADRSPKRWFRETPEYVQMAGLSFGVVNTPDYRAKIRSIAGSPAPAERAPTEEAPPTEVLMLSQSIEKMAIGLDALSLTGSQISKTAT